MQRLAYFIAVAGTVCLAVRGLCGADSTDSTNVVVGGPSTNASAPSTTGLFGDPVIARGDGIEIRESRLEDAFSAFKANLALHGQMVPENQRLMLKKQLLDRLILTSVVDKRATPADQQRGQEIAEKMLAESKKEFPSEGAFLLRIKMLGITLEKYQQRVREQALMDAVLEREVKSDIHVTEAAVQEFYTNGTDLAVRDLEENVRKINGDPAAPAEAIAEMKKRIDEIRKANLARLEQPERVRVLHLFMSVRNRESGQEIPESDQREKKQKMEELLKRARAGEDFAQLVQDHSEDINLKETKGEYTFARQDLFPEEFKTASFTIATNQISDVVATATGYHLIKLIEKIPAKKLEYDKAAEGIKDLLRSEEVEKRMPEYVARIRKEAAVQILDPKYLLKASPEGEVSDTGPR